MTTQCEWKDCDKAAEKHVRFGWRQQETIVHPEGLEMPFTMEHRDVCSEHAHIIKTSDGSYVEHELGGCPNDCGKDLVARPHTDS